MACRAQSGISVYVSLYLITMPYLGVTAELSTGQQWFSAKVLTTSLGSPTTIRAGNSIACAGKAEDFVDFSLICYRSYLCEMYQVEVEGYADQSALGTTADCWTRSPPPVTMMAAAPTTSTTTVVPSDTTTMTATTSTSPTTALDPLTSSTTTANPTTTSTTTPLPTTSTASTTTETTTSTSTTTTPIPTTAATITPDLTTATTSTTSLTTTSSTTTLPVTTTTATTTTTPDPTSTTTTPLPTTTAFPLTTTTPAQTTTTTTTTVTTTTTTPVLITTSTTTTDATTTTPDLTTTTPSSTTPALTTTTPTTTTPATTTTTTTEITTTLPPANLTCNGNVEISNPSGTLMTVASGNYPNNMNCSWRLVMPAGHRISFYFVSFQLESCCDYMGMKDNSTGAFLGGREFNGQTLPPNVTSTGNIVLVSFRSDFSVNYPGFTLRYTMVQ